MTVQPSEAYLRILEDSKNHHRHSKTWSGGLMVRHIERIKEMIDRLGCVTVLDYGCGKCIQYFNPMEDGRSVQEYWGVSEIFRYDPAMPPDFRRPPGMPADYRIETELPEGRQWDLIICTHSLGCIPVADLRAWAIPGLHRMAKKGIFLAENLSLPKKRVVKDRIDLAELHGVWTAADWMREMTLPGSAVEVEGWFRGRPGVDPRVEQLPGDAKFRKWPFE